MCSDASDVAICFIISQFGQMVVSSYHRKFTDTESRYAVVEKELLALVEGVKRHRPYLFDKKFTAHTDHLPLIGIINAFKAGRQHHNRRIERMLLHISEFISMMTIVFIAGIFNVISDFGTRLPSVAPSVEESAAPEGPPLCLLHRQEYFSSKTLSSIRTCISKRTRVDNNKGQKIPVRHDRIVSPLSHHDASSVSMVVKLASNDINFDELDYAEVQQYDASSSNKEGVVTVYVNKQKGWKIFVPTSQRRSLLWSHHAPLHAHKDILLHNLRDYVWPNMSEDVDIFLSTCVCANQKGRKPMRIMKGTAPEVKFPLQLLGIDLYEYKSEHYLTSIDYFSSFPMVTHIDSKTKDDIIDGLRKAESMFGAPKSYLSDQGGEFSEVSKLAEHLTTSSHRPMANGKIERFHQELGKACRIHDVVPDSAVIYLRTDEQRLKIFTFIAFHNEDIHKPVSTCDGLIHKYKVGNIVWKFVPKIARKKWHQVYAGPYVIKQLLVSDRTMMVGDYKLHSLDIKVHYADLKSCHLPNKNTPQTWRINKELFDSCINEWAIKSHFPCQYLRRLSLQNDKGTKRCKSTSKPNIYHYSTIPFTNKGIEAVYKCYCLHFVSTKPAVFFRDFRKT